MNRILIVKLWALGDILMATPLLRALKKQWPDCEITWLADKDYAGILTANPLLKEVIPFDAGAWRRHWRYGRLIAYWRMSRQLQSDLERLKFDAVINLAAEKWWALWFNVAPVRVGMFPTARSGWLRNRYTHTAAETECLSPHNTDRYLLTAQVLGCPIQDKRMVIGRPREEAYVHSLLERANHRENDPVVVIAPFSTGKNRCWEPERYAELSDRLRETVRATCIMTLGPKDKAQAEQIVHAARSPIVLAAGASLSEYLALVQRANVVVCSDSSAMHIAGASGTPYIALFGPTPVSGRAPLAGPGISLSMPLPCAPCDRNICSNPVFRECMKLIQVEDVCQAARTLLTAAGAR